MIIREVWEIHGNIYGSGNGHKMMCELIGWPISCP